MNVTRIDDGLYRVIDGEHSWTVAVAGPRENRWVWADGVVAQVDPPSTPTSARRRRASAHDLAAPMPATVVRVMARVGETVSRGDTLVMLEAMKMELPIHAPRDGVVQAVHCKEGELVQPGPNLIDLA